LTPPASGLAAQSNASLPQFRLASYNATSLLLAEDTRYALISLMAFLLIFRLLAYFFDFVVDC
jgi:hypothetical protein